MILKNIDFTAPTIRSKFDLSSVNINLSWNDYYSSYAYAVHQTMEAAFEMPFPYYPHSKAILFLMRHTLELLLKRELAKSGQVISNYTNLSEMRAELRGELPQELQRLIDIIDLDKDGFCYLYNLNPCTKSSYFSLDKVIQTAEYFSLHEKMVVMGIFPLEPICPTLRLHKDWDLNFQIGNELQYWHLRYQYDYIVEILVEGILNETVNLQKSFLPLLFLIRHTIELGLKGFVWDIALYTKGENADNLCKENNLRTLYEAFDSFLVKLDPNKMGTEMQEELNQLRRKFTQNSETINILDQYNNLFRLPGDSVIQIEKIQLADLLVLYYKSKSILTFNIETLVKEGVLPPVEF